jgi:hypothetical protein
MSVAGHWWGELEGASLELLIMTSQVGAWEVRLRELGGRQVSRWFDAAEQAQAYASSLLAVGEWRPAH